MFHSGTQTLIDHWTALPDAGRIPARADLDPMVFGGLLARMFAAERTVDGLRIRLAGQGIERLHGRDTLAGQDWTHLWRRSERTAVTAATVQAFRQARPIVLNALATRLDGALEIAIVPMRGPQGKPDRLIGLYQPLGAGGEDVGPLDLTGVIGVGPTGRAALSLATLDGRRTA